MDWTADIIKREVDYADQFIKNATASLGKRIADYHGSYFGASTAGQNTNIANHSFDFISLMLPRVLHTNPDIDMESARGGAPAEVAVSMRAAAVRWCRDSKFINTFERIMLDAFFCHSVTLITQREMTDTSFLAQLPPEDRKRFYEDDGGVGSMSTTFGGAPSSKPLWPGIRRVPVNMFGFDPACETFDQARFAYHKFLRPLSVLLKDAKDGKGGWDLAVLQTLKTITGVPTIMGDMGNREVPERDDIILCEVWVREHQFSDEHTPDEGFHGTIFTIAMNSVEGDATAQFVRAPRPFYGPREGPYVLGGVYPVPGNPLYLSPLAAVEEQVTDLNALEHSMTSSAKDYKRFTGVAQADYADAKRINKALHGWLVPLQSLDQGKIQEFEIGGITEQQIAQAQYMRDRVERTSGITEAARGNVTGIATASENLIAEEASNTRFDYLTQASERMAQAILHRIGWYLFHDDRIVFPVSPKDFAPVDGMEELEGIEMWFQGGDHDRSKGYTYEDLELSIAVGSMQKKNIARKRAETGELLQWTLQLIQFVPMIKGIEWSGIFKRLGEQYDWKGFENLFDFEQMGQSVPQQGEGAKNQGQVTAPKKVAGAKPTINVNVGGAGGAKTPKAKATAGIKK